MDLPKFRQGPTRCRGLKKCLLKSRSFASRRSFVGFQQIGPNLLLKQITPQSCFQKLSSPPRVHLYSASTFIPIADGCRISTNLHSFLFKRPNFALWLCFTAMLPLYSKSMIRDDCHRPCRSELFLPESLSLLPLLAC